MRRALSTTALCFVAFVVLSPAATAAEAAAITAVGWWSQRPGATELPAGSFEVALLPNAPQSIAALRVEVKAAPLTSALLELTEAEQVLGEVARVQACPTNDDWTPANPGAWGDAPVADCEGSSTVLGRNADGTWTADVESLLRGGSTSLVIVPVVEVSDQQQSAAFQVTFARARLVGSAPSESTPAPATPAPSFEPTTPTEPIAAGTVPAPDVAPVTTSLPTGTPPAATPAGTSFAAPAEPAGEPKPWWRLAVGVPVSLAAGGAAVFVRRWLRERELIGN